MNASLLENGGKQLRPIVTLLVARSLGGGTCNGDSVKCAVASELLHNATLLHDDVADESDERRSRPTLRRLMGPSASVLVGDFWLVRAVKAILDIEKDENRLVTLFAKTLADLAEGEMLQLQKASSLDTSYEDYMDIICRKTGSLFITCCTAGAVSVGASDAIRAAAAEYGRCIGCAFQIRDDIFDYMPRTSVGKPVGVDLVEGKITLPLLGALKNMTPAEDAALRASLRGITPSRRDEVVALVREKGGLEYAQRVLGEFVAKAVDALSAFPDGKDKEYLARLARYIAIREK